MTVLFYNVSSQRILRLVVRYETHNDRQYSGTSSRECPALGPVSDHRGASKKRHAQACSSVVLGSARMRTRAPPPLAGQCAMK